MVSVYLSRVSANKRSVTKYQVNCGYTDSVTIERQKCDEDRDDC